MSAHNQYFRSMFSLLGVGVGFGVVVPVAMAGEMEFGAIVPAIAPNSMAQVTSVSQLSDVKPTDWAFQALQSLVERYGCIVGYPDRTYRGNRALTRYEFAAGLNACMDRVNELIAAATSDLVKKTDLATLQKLQEEFAAELATLRGRVDNLEAKTTTLEKQQFSTTTKLNAELVTGLVGVAAGTTTGFDPLGNLLPGRAVSRNTVLGYRARLNLDTSFTGEDLLRTRIQAGNSDFSQAAMGIPEGSLRLAGNSDSRATIDALLYQFPLGKQTGVTLEANAGAIDDFTDTLNPYLDGDGGTGALTHFGTRNPIYYLVGGAGIGIKHQFGEKLELSAGFLASDPANPTGAAGLFKGAYGAIAQLTFKPSAQLKVGFTYVNAYKNTFQSGGSPTGSIRANLLTGVDTDGDGVNDSLATIDNPFVSNSFGFGASFQLTPNIVINGNLGYTKSRILAAGTLPTGNLDIWNWSVGLAFPDLGKKGNLAGLIVGMEPKVTGVSSSLSAADFTPDRNTSLHIEGFYQYQLNDKISITPGIIWLTAPDHDNRNSGVVIGTIRTTFTF
jgi:Carbohydrate-selective porin, OprB family/S-layer homology domain